MGEFKRLAGASLNLRHDLFPTPDAQKYARATLTDKNGASVGSGTVDLTAVGFGLFVDTSEAMPSTEMLVAKIEVFDDAAYTELSCDYPGDTDVYELETLQPSQLPGDAVLEAEIITAQVEAEITDGEVSAEITGGEVEAELETQETATEIETTELDAESDQAEVEANKDC